MNKINQGRQPGELSQAAYEQLLLDNNLEQRSANCDFAQAQLVVLSERGHIAFAPGIGVFYRQTAGPNAVLAYEGVREDALARTTGLTPEDSVGAVSWEDPDLYQIAWNLEVQQAQLNRALREERQRRSTEPGYLMAQIRAGGQTELARLLHQSGELATQRAAMIKPRSDQALKVARDLIVNGKLPYVLIGEGHVNDSFLADIADLQYVIVQSNQPFEADEDAQEGYYLDEGNGPRS